MKKLKKMKKNVELLFFLKNDEAEINLKKRWTISNRIKGGRGWKKDEAIKIDRRWRQR